MTDKQVRSDEARRNFKDLLNDVEHRGYHVAILRYDQPAAVLVPVDWYEDAWEAWGAQVDKNAGSAT